MNISVKKFSKKSLSLLIALIMVFSALPLTPPISADAATTTTLNKDSFGMLTNGGTSRFNNKKFNIVNDQGDNNTSAGLLHYDLSSFADTNISTVTFNVTIDSFLDEPNIDKVNFYYSTTINNASTYLSEDGVENANLRWGNGSGNTAVTKYSSKLGFKANQILYQQPFIKNTSNATGSIDVTSIFKNIVLSGAKDLYIVIMHNTAGNANSNNNWSDTTITPAKINFTVTYSNYDFNSVSGNKEYIDANIDNFAMPTAQSVTCNGTNLNLSNVLYTSNTYLDNSLTEFSLNNKASDTKMTAKLMSPSNRIVYMYTGNNSIVKVPLIFEVGKGENVSTLQRYTVNYICSASNSWNLDYNNWTRTKANNNWDTDTSGEEDGVYLVSSSSSHNVTDYNASNSGKGISNTKDFKNIATFNGNLSFTNNYFTISELPSVDMSFDGFCYWYNWGDNYLYPNNISKTTKNLEIPLSTISLANTASYSVIDFSGYNVLVSNNTMKNKYNTVKDNETKYTDDSLLAYYKAVANLIKFKTAGYDLSTDSGVESCARELATVVSNYNTAERGLARKTVSVNFYDAMLLPKKELNVTPGTTIYESALPALTQPIYNKNNQHSHYIYYWGYSDGTAFTVPYTVNDNVDIYEKSKIENCSLAVKSIDGNTSTVSCSVCNGGTYTLDIKAYRDIVSVAQEAINDKAKYDSASRANLQTVLNDNTVNDCITIKQVDAKISAIQTAINELVLNKYSITVKYVDELGNDLKVGEEGATSKTYPAVNYGSIQNIVAPTNYNKVDYAVYKWTREDKSSSSISGLNSSSLDVVVKGASTYYVFLKNTSVDESQASGKAVITLNNKSNKVYDIGYVAISDSVPVIVDVDNGTITIDGKKLTAPNYSFYNITGFNINGKIITGTDTVSITKDTVIRPVYEAKQTVRITRASANILINGKNDDSVDVEWNKKIVMTYNGEVPDGKVVIWKDGNGNVLAQGPTYSFYANSNVTISATVEASAPKDPTASIGLFSYDPTDNKVTVVNNFYVPEGKKAVKAGVILSTKSTLADMSNEERVNFLKDQTTGRFYGTEDKFSGTDTNKNQIRISVTRTANTSFTMYALAYVVVIENGKEKPYYAPTVQSITYTGTNS